MTSIFYVRNDNRVLIICPACGYNRQFDLSQETARKLRRKKSTCKFHCRCGNKFYGRIEFRRTYRKKVCLRGTCQNLEDLNQYDIMVEDLSLDGIRFIIVGPAGIRPGDRLELSFRLDNPKRSMIFREALVRWINNNRIGAEFSISPQLKTDLGLYLLK